MKSKLKIIVTAAYAAIFLVFAMTGSLQSQANETDCGTHVLVDQLEMSLLEALVSN